MDLLSLAALSTMAKKILTTSLDRSTRIFEASTGKEIKSMPQEHLPSGAVAISRDEKLAGVGSLNGDIQIWSLENLEKKFTSLNRLTGENTLVSHLLFDEKSAVCIFAP